MNSYIDSNFDIHNKYNISIYDDSIDGVEKLIDIIFNDFESRTCENCRHIAKTEYQGTWCGNNDNISILETQIPIDCSCNKWERKDDDNF